MMRKLLLITTGLLVGGCLGPMPVPESDTELRPRQHDALSVVWFDTFGRTDPPPTVHFVTGDALATECGGMGWVNAFLQVCVGGERVGRDVYLAWPEGMTWARSALAHEATHVLIGREDWQHKNQAWAPGGPVTQATKALVDAGL